MNAPEKKGYFHTQKNTAYNFHHTTHNKHCGMVVYIIRITLQHVYPQNSTFSLSQTHHIQPLNFILCLLHIIFSPICINTLFSCSECVWEIHKLFFETSFHSIKCYVSLAYTFHLLFDL